MAPLRRRWPAARAVVVGLLTCLLGCAAPEEGSRLAILSERLSATQHLQPYHMPVVTLTDQTGAPFELRARAAGKVTVLYFGYTQCPDVCPITMSRVARALSMLDSEARARVLAVFITVDPERDSPEDIGRWLGAMDSSIYGLTGSQEAVDDAVRQLGFMLPPLERPDSGWYEVAHPAALFLFTPELLGRYGYPHGDPTPEALAEDLRTLVTFDW